MNRIELHQDSLILEKEYHFENGRLALNNWLSLVLSDDDIQRLKEFVANYPLFATADLSDSLATARECIFEVISYCDTHARNKSAYNKYDDDRVLAKAGIRMGPWVKHLYYYKYERSLTNTSVRYAMQMLTDPQTNINALSVGHRQYIAAYYLREAYDEATFVPKLIDLIDPIVKASIVNPENLTPSIAKQLYREKNKWLPSIKSFKELKPLIEKYIEENQADIILGYNEPKNFYWFSDVYGFFNTSDAHYEFYRKAKEISVDLHFENTKREKNVDLLDALGELPDFLERKKWQNAYSVSHVRKFTLDTPDLIENLFECLDDLYNFSYPLLIDKLQNRNPQQALPMNLNDVEKRAIDVIQYKKQIILQGPPGTGKTRAAERIADYLTSTNRTSESIKVSIKKLTVEFIKSKLKEGLTLKSKSNQDLSVLSVGDHTVSIKSAFSKPWKPSYRKIIQSFEEQLWTVKGRSGGFVLYEDAVAKYLFDNYADEIPLVDVLDGDEEKTTTIVQFHPSFTYEDFVRGIEAKTSDELEGINYSAANKVIAQLAEIAHDNAEKKYVLIIDEINRANLSAVLGELIYALEYRGQEVDSMYEVNGSTKISLPENLYIIGTMNTADRSVGHIDYAIRRRFAFIDVPPQALQEDDKIWFNESDYNSVQQLFQDKNVSPEFEAKDVQLGHSYFLVPKEKAPDAATRDKLFRMKLDYEVKPILREYVRDGVLIGEVNSLGVSMYIEKL